jgi:hypothetical protein
MDAFYMHQEVNLFFSILSPITKQISDIAVIKKD